MMPDIYIPAELSASELDEYLARGWYRMAQMVFTTSYIEYNGRTYRVYWLRYDVNNIEFNKKHLSLFRNNRDFTVELQPLVIDDELENLYFLYRKQMLPEGPLSVTSFLVDGATQQIFNTKSFLVRHQGKLIAAGIFDEGGNSMAGLMNFYHPDYKKYSPGKHLMLLKCRYAKEIGMQWYYPGYIVAGNPRFDYKLFLSPSEACIYIPELEIWVNYEMYWNAITAK